jgi:ketosteroid isomerase-like protein
MATQQTPGVALAHAYIVALQAKDKQAILDMIAEDFVIEVPLNAPGTNDLTETWRGIEGAHAVYDMAFSVIELLVYTDIEITPAMDPNIAFLEGRGVMRMANGRPYGNRYVFRFEVENGKIRKIREYANPVTAAVAFGLPLPQPELA